MNHTPQPPQPSRSRPILPLKVNRCSPHSSRPFSTLNPPSLCISTSINATGATTAAQHPTHHLRRLIAMEIEGLGARCALPSCRHLDFLPFRCPHCTDSFCREHQTPNSHNCRSLPARPDVPTCPLCRAAVPVPSNSTPDQAVNRHIDAGCPKRVRANPECSFRDCSVRDVVVTNCPACRNKFCLAHRLEADHECPVEQNSKPGLDPFGNRVRGSSSAKHSKTRKTPPLFSRRSSANTSSSASKSAGPSSSFTRGHSQIRLDFSNTPSNPIGDKKVDPEDRIHVALFFPVASKLPPRYTYFSGRLSAGRIIDILKRDVKGIPSAADGQRYSLYAVKRGVSGVNLLPRITPLKDLPSDVLQSGDAIVLEQGEGGLNQEWLSALKKLGSSPKFLSSRRSSGKEKCAVA